MASVITDYIETNTLKFACAISGVIKAFSEIVAAKLLINVVVVSNDAVRVYWSSYPFVIIDKIKKALEDIEKNVFIDTNNHLDVVLLFLIVLDILTSYVIQIICDDVMNIKTPAVKDYLNSHISYFFHYRLQFIDFIIDNLSTIVRANHQIYETSVRNIMIVILILLYVREVDVLCIMILIFFIFGIAAANFIQLIFNNNYLTIDINTSNGLKDFINKYNNLSNHNYIVKVYGCMCLLFIIMYMKYDLMRKYLEKILRIPVNPIDSTIRVALVLFCILFIRIAINAKISRMPLYLKKSSDVILRALSVVIYKHGKQIENDNKYDKIIAKDLNIQIDYDGSFVTLLNTFSAEFVAGNKYIISSDNLGKSAILKTLLLQFCNNRKVFYANGKNEFCINDIKDINKTSILLNNQYTSSTDITHLYDSLMDNNYYSSIKRQRISKIMEIINSNYRFIGIDNEMFNDFSDNEVRKILKYINDNCLDILKNKILIITVRKIDMKLVDGYDIYNINNGILSLINNTESP